MPNFIGSSLRGNSAVGQNNHLVGNPKGLFQVVGHHNAGNAQSVVELTNQLGGGTK